jgi:hypothetical protein
MPPSSSPPPNSGEGAGEGVEADFMGIFRRKEKGKNGCYYF